MQPLLTAASYVDADLYAREQASLFSRTWLFAGFASDVATHQDWLTADVAGRSVIVQNFDGELRAFANVCSHRFARIRGECRGNGPLRCSYHGWIYNKDGVPYSIPSRPRFDDLTPETLEQLRLRAYRVETCGPVVFVSAAADGPSLREFLTAPVAERLEAIGRGLGPCIDRNEMVIGANWKVTVENTLESYHVGFVHTDTFKKLGTKGMEFGFEGPHSSWQASVSDAVAAQMAKVVPLFGERTFPVDGYFHQHVFPNFTFATTYGTSFAFQLFHPDGPGRTRFTSVVFQARLAEGPRARAAGELLSASVAQFNRDVFEEDRVVCELVQRGASEGDRRGILSDEEARVGHFQRALVAAISD